MKSYYMGIDIGTYESKGVLIDEEMHVIARAKTAHGLENPKPNYFEHDAEEVWWKDFCILSKKLIAESGVRSIQIKCVGASALSADVVPVDEDCVPLRKAILYGIDARAIEEERQISDYYGEKRMEKLIGRPLCSSDCMPKILWIKNNEPEVYEKTAKFLTASSYLTAKLTGEYVIDRYLAISSFAPCYNEDLTINKEITEELYCREDQLAYGKETTDVVGYVTSKAALETGLSEGTAVVTGTDDSGAEAISTGVLNPGDFMVQLGSSCYLMLCTKAIHLDDRIWSEDYLIKGTYCMDGGTNTAGSLTKWVRDNLYKDYVERAKKEGGEAFSYMVDSIKQIPAGSEGLVVLPYFAGERTPIHDEQAKGVVIGLLLNHTRDHIFKACLEGVAYSIRQHVEIFEEHGETIRNFYVAGGGVKNPVWLQAIADVTGKTVKIAKETMGASYGDALIAAVGVGAVSRFADLEKYIEIEKEYKPDKGNEKVYNELYSQFLKIYEDTKSTMHQLGSI